MGRASTRILTIQKFIEKKQIPNVNKRTRTKQAEATEEPNNSAQQSPVLLDHTQVDQPDSEQVVVNAELDPPHGSLTLLEKYDNELKFIAAHASALELTWKKDIVDEVNQMKAEDEYRNSQEILSGMIDSEIMSECYRFDDEEDVLPQTTASVVEDELAACIRELQEQEIDTIPGTCCVDGLLLGQEIGESSDVLPVATVNVAENKKMHHVQTELDKEIQMSRNDDDSVQARMNGIDCSLMQEDDFHVLGITLSQQTDLDVVDMSN